MLPPGGVSSLSWRKELGSLQRRALPWGLESRVPSGVPCVVRAYYSFIIHLFIDKSSVGLLIVGPSEPWGPR